MKWLGTFSSVTLLIFLSSVSSSEASSTDGTIDSTSKYAWSNDAGWINFAASNGNVHVTDAALTGYVWSNNYGWINLNPTLGGISNDSEGDLGGFAWGTSLGWIDFSDVYIDDSGYLHGTATGPIINQLSFDCTNCAVLTDWRPLSIRNPTIPPSSGGGGGGGGSSAKKRVVPGLPETGNTASTSVSTKVTQPLIQSLTPVTPRFPNLGTQPVLPLGAVSENIRTLQVFLNTLGFTIAAAGPGSPGKETNIFGPLTKAALARFQAANGIVPATGYFGPKTRAFIAALSLAPSVPVQTGQAGAAVVAADPTFTRNLERGMSGLDVIALQQLLITKNTGPAAAALTRSGTSIYFGAFTEAAVIEYQKAHGITPAIGYFGPVTRSYIEAR